MKQDKVDAAIETILEIMEAFDLSTDESVKVLSEISSSFPSDSEESPPSENEKSLLGKYYFRLPQKVGFSSIGHWGLDINLILEEH